MDSVAACSIAHRMVTVMYSKEMAKKILWHGSVSIGVGGGIHAFVDGDVTLGFGAGGCILGWE
jgi:hypothetical protein